LQATEGATGEIRKVSRATGKKKRELEGQETSSFGDHSYEGERGGRKEVGEGRLRGSLSEKGGLEKRGWRGELRLTTLDIIATEMPHIKKGGERRKAEVKGKVGSRKMGVCG